MKKTTSRQILSAVLSLVFCVSVIVSIPFTASAAYEAYAADGSVVTEADIILDQVTVARTPVLLALMMKTVLVVKKMMITSD